MNYIKSSIAVAVLLSPVAAQAGNASVCFTPASDCETQIVRQIEGAKREILVQAYVFTADPIAEALISAHRRGVSVSVLLDKSQLNVTKAKAKKTHKAGVSVSVDGSHSIAHNKIILIDGKTVITGSYNFTKSAATRHAENVVFIRDPEIFQQYLSNWRDHLAHARPYEVP